MVVATRCTLHVGWAAWRVSAGARGGITSRVMTALIRRPVPVRHCGWCGARLPDDGKVGRPRRYCSQSCRQRAYERRAAVQRGGLPEDAVVLSGVELADLQDRLFQLRCAAEDVATAADDGADPAELKHLAAHVIKTAADLERLR
jgi:predicted nucleic acid-binding Zn ribbon protein